MAINDKGRPSEYREDYISKVDEYLAANEDEEIEVVKQRNEEKGYEMYERKLRVRLPTKEGFAQFLGVSKKTLYNWADEHEDFLHALEKIEVEQQKRLVNYGLSGDYNPTIAKLILSSNHGMAEKQDLTSKGEKLSVQVVNYADTPQLPAENIPAPAPEGNGLRDKESGSDMA